MDTFDPSTYNPAKDLAKYEKMSLTQLQSASDQIQEEKQKASAAFKAAPRGSDEKERLRGYKHAILEKEERIMQNLQEMEQGNRPEVPEVVYQGSVDSDSGSETSSPSALREVDIFNLPLKDLGEGHLNLPVNNEAEDQGILGLFSSIVSAFMEAGGMEIPASTSEGAETEKAVPAITVSPPSESVTGEIENGQDSKSPVSGTMSPPAFDIFNLPLAKLENAHLVYKEVKTKQDQAITDEVVTPVVTGRLEDGAEGSLSGLAGENAIPVIAVTRPSDGGTQGSKSPPPAAGLNQLQATDVKETSKSGTLKNTNLSSKAPWLSKTGVLAVGSGVALLLASPFAIWGLRKVLQARKRRNGEEQKPIERRSHAREWTVSMD